MRLRRPRGYPKKECSGCGKPLEQERYKKSRYCRKCHAKHMRMWRKKKKKELQDLKKKLKEYEVKPNMRTGGIVDGGGNTSVSGNFSTSQF